MNEEVWVEDGVSVVILENELSDNQKYKKAVDRNFIQFHFCTKGFVNFLFNNGTYSIKLHEEHSLLLYNPQHDLPLDLEIQNNSCVITLLISIKKFHSLFSREADYIPFLDQNNRNKKYYSENQTPPSIVVVLNQILNYSLHTSVKSLYFKAKLYELLSLYYNRPEDADIEQCPFLADEENVLKIKNAKEIIIKQMTEPPTLQELSNEVGLSVNKLKEGFKQLYGEPVFTFLFDYKMEVARKLLITKAYNVNEVGLKVGYSTSSHFIAAFKKKFGTTPKKFLKTLN